MYVMKAKANESHLYPTKSRMSWSPDKNLKTLLTISYWDTESSPGWYYIGVLGQCINSNNAPAKYRIEAFQSSNQENDLSFNPNLGSNLQISAGNYQVSYLTNDLFAYLSNSIYDSAFLVVLM